MTKDDILKRTTLCGDCMIWTGSFVHHTNPVLTMSNKKLYVKRVLMHLDERKIEGKCVISTCGQQSCVNPDHLQIITRKALAIRTAATGYQSNLAIKAKIAATKRAKSNLSNDAVLEIRHSNEPVTALAARHGITDSYAYMIRRNQCRKDYQNPFSGLIK